MRTVVVSAMRLGSTAGALSFAIATWGITSSATEGNPALPPANQGTRNLGLDVVRALAISLVLVCHWSGAISWWLGLHWPQLVAVSGFFGVELFFALSGFLIGTLLLELLERDPSLRGWWRFMVRRWMRTLPLYGLCLAAMALLWRPEGSLPAYLVQYGSLTQNLLWPMPKGDWFGVSWSLSVEEWFYLLFSACLIGSVALTGRLTACTWGVIALFIIVPTILRWEVPDSAEWDDHMRKVVALRLDAITYGVAIAKLYRDRSLLMRWPALLLIAGLAIIVEQWFEPIPLSLLPVHVQRVFYLTSAPLAFSLCLPAALRVRRLPSAFAWLARRLSAQAYPLYLVHLVLIDAVSMGHLRFGLSPVVCVVASGVLVFGVSHILHNWCEVPIMIRRPKQYSSPLNPSRQPPARVVQGEGVYAPK